MLCRIFVFRSGELRWFVRGKKYGLEDWGYRCHSVVSRAVSRSKGIEDGLIQVLCKTFVGRLWFGGRGYDVRVKRFRPTCV